MGNRVMRTRTPVIRTTTSVSVWGGNTRFFLFMFSFGLQRWQVTGWRGGGRSEGPRAGTRTRSRCSEDQASVHGTPALPAGLNGAPSIRNLIPNWKPSKRAINSISIISIRFHRPALQSQPVKIFDKQQLRSWEEGWTAVSIFLFTPSTVMSWSLSRDKCSYCKSIWTKELDYRLLICLWRGFTLDKFEKLQLKIPNTCNSVPCSMLVCFTIIWSINTVR